MVLTENSFCSLSYILYGFLYNLQQYKTEYVSVFLFFNSIYAPRGKSSSHTQLVIIVNKKSKNRFIEAMVLAVVSSPQAYVQTEICFTTVHDKTESHN